MDAKETGSISPQFDTHDKGNNYSTTYKVLEILKSMQKITAIGLNNAVKFNDGRKAISLLKKQGFPIEDFKISGGRKVYFLSESWEEIMNGAKRIDRQLNLFNYV